jgi:catechol 2,3-dioxygenase-like lactoylglutathione lyase family enzyme
MLLYTTIGTNDIARAIAFWRPVMRSLGHREIEGLGAEWAGWGESYDSGFGFYICTPFDGHASSAGNGSIFAFPAKDAGHVRELYALALQNGGADEGAPGTREYYTPDFYVAYARSPDRHKLAFVFNHFDPTTDCE